MVKFTGNVSDFLKIGVAAAARGDLDSVREILKHRPKWIKHAGSHGRTMLWEACHRGKLPMVKYLVKRKADINAFGSHYTPYFVDISCYCIARFKKRHEVADYLLDKGAKQNIFSAAYLGDTPAVKKYLSSNRKLLKASHPQHGMAEKNDEGLDFVPVQQPWATPLCYALRGGNPETVQLLIERGARIKGIETKLFEASDDEPVLVEMLLNSGADAKYAPFAMPGDESLEKLLRSHGRRTPKKILNEELVYVCRGDRGGDAKEVRQLIESGANVNHQDKKGKTALHRAAKAGFEKTIRVLLELDASMEIALSLIHI